MNDNETGGMPKQQDVFEEPLVRRLRASIRHAARVLAVLMVMVIWWGVADVVYEMCIRDRCYDDARYPVHV